MSDSLAKKKIAKKLLHASPREKKWKKDDINRPIRASKHSISGLYIAFRSEQAFRVAIYMGLGFFLLGLWLHIWVKPFSLYQWLFFLVGYAVILLVELLNSALEILCDLVEPDYHISIKFTKDVASAAVFLSYSLNAILWAAILAQNFIFD